MFAEGFAVIAGEDDQHSIVQASLQPPAAVQNVGTYDRGSFISLRLKCLRHAANLRPERLPGKVLHSVVKRIGPSEQAGMARQGQWDLGISMLKQHARPC